MTVSKLPPGSRTTGTCRVSVIIKALNEEDNIAASVESALAAVAGVGGEVVLADSHSTDQTVARAAAYPIRIVQLANPAERSCGIGPQLGYQHCLGDYIYILDGDMKMAPGFLEEALQFMARHPEVAGVGGAVVESNLEGLEYRERAQRAAGYPAGEVDRLDCGGLYRRLAIAEAGYFSDRNLHSYEEFDLAVRLRARGWKLWRLPLPAAMHYGHEAPPYRLLVRRWKTRYVCGVGELVRAASGEPRMRFVLRGLRELRIYGAVLLWWAVLLSIAFWPLSAWERLAAFTLLALAPWVLMSLRKRSIQRGAYSVVSWCFNTAGLVRGLLRRRVPAAGVIDSRVLREPVQETGLRTMPGHDLAGRA